MIRNNRRVAALALGGALTIAPAVTGCGAGFSPQTIRPSQPPQGLNLQIPQDTSKPALMEIRNLFILGPQNGTSLAAGAAAPVYAGLIDSNPDGQGDQLVSVTTPSFACGTEITGGQIALPPNKLVSLNTGKAPLVVLKGLTAPKFGGEYVTLTLRFARAGEVTVQVPIVPWNDHDAYSTYPPAPSASPSASPTTSGSPSAQPGKHSPSPKRTETPSPSPSASASASATP